MRDLFLGIDVGGSRTRALVADAEGRALGYGEAGPGNHEVVGYGGLAAAMAAALGSALESAGKGDRRLERSPGAIFAGAGFGVAGFDWESERADTLGAVARLGLSCPIDLRVDAALGLAAGAAELWGVNVVAGTGNNCYGLGPDGREGRLAGSGPRVGEEGGAGEIAARALKVVNQARIRRLPPTALSERLCRLAGYADPESLVEAFSLRDLRPDPAWAPEIFAVARSGDEAALGIVEWAGRELGESAAAVIRQLGIEEEAFDVVLSGSLFELEPSLEPPLRSVLAAVAPRARTLRLEAPPVTGAVILGARAAGLGGGASRAAAFRAALLDSVSPLARRGGDRLVR